MFYNNKLQSAPRSKLEDRKTGNRLIYNKQNIKLFEGRIIFGRIRVRFPAGERKFV